MEVHHQTHTERKKWYHYFWEFFMLFLAVTLGFLVENMREHYVEHKREKDLAKGLYKDIKIDTSQLNKVMGFRKTRAAQLDSLFLLLEQPFTKMNKVEIYRLALKSILYSSSNFSRTTGTSIELKNSGYLRYFTGTPIPANLAAYDASIEGLEEFQKLEFNEITERYVPEIWQHFDASALNNSWYEHKPFAEDPDFIEMDKKNINYLKSFILSLKLINRNINERQIPTTLQIAVSFLRILKAEYHLK